MPRAKDWVRNEASQSISGLPKLCTNYKWTTWAQLNVCGSIKVFSFLPKEQQPNTVDLYCSCFFGCACATAACRHKGIAHKTVRAIRLNSRSERSNFGAPSTPGLKPSIMRARAHNNLLLSRRIGRVTHRVTIERTNARALTISARNQKPHSASHDIQLKFFSISPPSP